MLASDHRGRQPSQGRDREVVASGAATLHGFGDERGVRKRIEGEIEALKFGASLDGAPGTRHAGFGCHDAFSLRELDLMHSRCILLRPRHPEADGHQPADRARNFRMPPRSRVVAACAGYQNLHDALQRRQDGLANHLPPGEKESIGPNNPLQAAPTAPVLRHAGGAGRSAASCCNLAVARSTISRGSTQAGQAKCTTLPGRLPAFSKKRVFPSWLSSAMYSPEVRHLRNCLMMLACSSLNLRNSAIVNLNAWGNEQFPVGSRQQSDRARARSNYRWMTSATLSRSFTSKGTPGVPWLPVCTCSSQDGHDGDQRMPCCSLKVRYRAQAWSTASRVRPKSSSA